MITADNCEREKQQLAGSLEPLCALAHVLTQWNMPPFAMLVTRICLC